MASEEHLENCVSVIIPTWNREGSLIPAIQSALRQSHVLEVLVCDDVSTDGSQRAVEALADPRVRWLPSTTGHAGHAAVPRNLGLRAAKGLWVAFLDSDDEWMPNKLELQLAAMEGHQTLASCTNATRWVPGEGEKGNLISWKKERIQFKDLMVVNRVVCSSCVVRRDVLIKAGGFSEHASLTVGEDYNLWMKVATFSDFSYLDQALVRYRDDLYQSIRARGIREPWRQKKMALEEFFRWAQNIQQNQEFNARFFKAAKSSYRRLFFAQMKAEVKKLVKRFLRLPQAGGPSGTLPKGSL